MTLSKDTNKRKSILDFRTLVGIGLVILFLGIGLLIIFSANNSLDWKGLDQQIKTNETLTNSFDCDKVQYYYEEAKSLFLTPHPEIVKDFHDLGLKKGCAFVENTK